MEHFVSLVMQNSAVFGHFSKGKAESVDELVVKITTRDTLTGHFMYSARDCHVPPSDIPRDSKMAVRRTNYFIRDTNEITLSMRPHYRAIACVGRDHTAYTEQNLRRACKRVRDGATRCRVAPRRTAQPATNTFCSTTLCKLCLRNVRSRWRPDGAASP